MQITRTPIYSFSTRTWYSHRAGVFARWVGILSVVGIAMLIVGNASSQGVSAVETGERQSAYAVAQAERDPIIEDDPYIASRPASPFNADVTVNGAGVSGVPDRAVDKARAVAKTFHTWSYGGTLDGWLDTIPVTSSTREALVGATGGLWARVQGERLSASAELASVPVAVIRPVAFAGDESSVEEWVLRVTVAQRVTQYDGTYMVRTQAVDVTLRSANFGWEAVGLETVSRS